MIIIIISSTIIAIGHDNKESTTLAVELGVGIGLALLLAIALCITGIVYYRR